tara:strand:+ start:545 stop:1444 length:900 start_codon:yes stop_codon:yes gene_type:complete
MTNKVWTTEEMNEINDLRKAGNSWQYIADKMYYTYEDGYLVSAHELDAQHKLWLEQEKAFEKANKLYDVKSELRLNNPPRRKMGRLSILEKTEIIQYTEIHKMGIEDIAKKMNRTTEAIKNYLKKYNKSKRQMAELEKAKDVSEIAEVINPIMNTENILLDPEYTAPITEEEIKTKVIKNLSLQNKMFQDKYKEMMEANAMNNSEDSTISSADLIKNQCDIISQMLVAKNEQYGDSVFKPMRIFSKVDATQQLRVRIDDKISRLIRGNDSIESDEDIIDDLIGYLILLKIQMRNTHSHD